MQDDRTTDAREGQRTSLYLVRRADALLGALRFFAAEAGGDTARRRLQFLAQSDFWEWEVDNLIYSFTNLAERRETWRSPKSAVEKLARLGIAVDTKLVSNAKWRGRWMAKTVDQRVAPVALLRETVALWNELVALAEKQFVAPMREKADKWNLQTRRDLSALRKTMPDLKEIGDDYEDD